ncbi:MAG: Rossmann-like domain-containing protein [Tractidigestivibacter sp.]|jgi:uncharacterized protein (DUF4213/DUF364 family)|uniref:Rossmann-like domain-containing protein n=1 Tax=Tractidigestivibacter sp. TaxID=2847320 RepID=UPI003D8BC8B8
MTGFGAWSLYEELLGGIPTDVLVRDVCMGAHWSYVEAESGMGVASTCKGGTRHRLNRSSLVGRPLAEVAALVRSWDFEAASIGVAAMNAWYNTPSLPGVNGDESWLATSEDSGKGALEGDPFFTVPQLMHNFCKQKGRPAKTVVVGHFPNMEGMAKEGELYVLERSPRSDIDLPDSACEYLLPEADYALLTGMTEANKTMPRLLSLASGATTWVVGPSTTLSSLILDAGASSLAGSVVEDPEKLRDCVTVGGSPVRASGLKSCVITRG